MDINIKMQIEPLKNNESNLKTGFIEIISFYSHEDTNCLLKNLNNRYVSKLHLFIHPEIKVDSHTKLIKIPTTFWPTYQSLISYANHNLHNKIICILNSQIYLDDEKENYEDLVYLLNEGKKVFCLSRIEINKEGKKWKEKSYQDLLYANQQDAWIFKTPLQIENLNFEFGKSNSIIAFSHRLRNHGFQLLNQGMTFRIYHLNRNKVEEYQYQSQEGIDLEPEKKGYYLLPEADEIEKISFDQIIHQFNLSAIDIYHLKCDILTRYATLKI